MHILVTNDDGVTAPGLLVLAQAMRQFGHVSIVAPDKDWSGCGHSKTLNRPLRVREVSLGDGTAALACDGTPADCVALAVMGLLPQKVDLVVSGINSMANLGHDVSYSGTVAAAKEANVWGISGIAVSLDGKRTHQKLLDYSLSASVACEVVQMVIKKGLPKNVFFNVNVPYLPADAFRGIRTTRQGMRVYRDRLDKRQDPRGYTYYWIGGDTPTGLPKEGTDIGAMAVGYASVTPLELDLTAYHAMPSLMEWCWTEMEPIPTNGVLIGALPV